MAQLAFGHVDPHGHRDVLKAILPWPRQSTGGSRPPPWQGKTVTLNDSTLSTSGVRLVPAAGGVRRRDRVSERRRDPIAYVAAKSHAQAQSRKLNSQGKPQSVRTKKLITVEECFRIPEPDTSWMSNPPSAYLSSIGSRIIGLPESGISAIREKSNNSAGVIAPCRGRSRRSAAE